MKNPSRGEDCYRYRSHANLPHEAKRYEGRVKNGCILVSVHCDDSDWVKKAEVILKHHGAEDISSAGEKAASTHGVETTHVR